MRKAARFVVLVFLSLISTVVLAVVTALMSAVSLAATALIVPGTGNPNPAPDSLYTEHTLRYLEPFSDCDESDCDLQPVPYSASFFPFVIFPGWCDPGRCDTWNKSVETGVEGLHSALLDPELGPGSVVFFGYSQGGAVVSNELRAIADNPVLLDKISSIVLIGNAYNPDGGLFTRLGFLPTIPFLDITFGPATPIDTGIEMTGIGFEYDPVMYAPLYWGNPLALFNAFAAFDNVHGYYLTPDTPDSTDSIAYGYTEAELEEILATDCPGAHCRIDSEGNEYYMIPAKGLPMMDLIMSVVPDPLKPLVKPFVDLTSPVAKVLIDLGYNWSGDPGQTRYLSILPFSLSTNWFQVGVDLVEAVGEGLENVFGGGTTIIAPPSDANPSTFALKSESSSTLTDSQEGDATETDATETDATETDATETEGTDDEVVDDEAVEDEAVEDEAVDDEAVDDEAVDDEAVDDEAVDDEAVGDEAVEDEAVEDEAVEDEAVDDESTTDDAVSEDDEATDDTETADADNDADNSTDNDADADKDADNDADNDQAAA